MAEKFDKELCKVVGDELRAAAAAIAAKYGMTVRGKGGTFSDASFTSKIEFSIPTAKAEAKKQTGVYASLLGLPEDIIGKTFSQGRKTFKVVGLNPRRPKNAVELESNDGKSYKCSVDLLNRMMA